MEVISRSEVIELCHILGRVLLFISVIICVLAAIILLCMGVYALHILMEKLLEFIAISTM